MRHKRDFLIVAALVTTWFALAQFPHIGYADQHGAEYKAGWPVVYEFWSVLPERRKWVQVEEYQHERGFEFWGVPLGERVNFHRFSLSGLLGDVGAWFILIAIVWFLTWPRPRRGYLGHAGELQHVGRAC